MSSSLIKPLYFNSTSDEGRELSNFYDAPFQLQLKVGIFEFRYAENAYQMLKHKEITKALVAEWMYYDPLTAKRKGAKLKLREDWGTKKFEAMEYVLRGKFTNRHARSYLLGTGDRELIHFSPWDIVWGVDHEGKGGNHLGRILMDIRRTI
jgi:ribA/ribD-fused uncharacterized protein